MVERMCRGGCACGSVTLQARGEPIRVGICHCLTCRKISGSAFGAFVIFAADRVAVDGVVESWASGEDCERCFCPRCGSTLFNRCGDEIELGLGSFDEPNAFEPTYEAWVVRREHWLNTPGLHPYPRNRNENRQGAPDEGDPSPEARHPLGKPRSCPG